MIGKPENVDGGSASTDPVQEFRDVIAEVTRLAHSGNDRPRGMSISFDSSEDMARAFGAISREQAERQPLESYLDSLDLETLANLQAVMYCGRDRCLDVLGHRESLAPFRREDVIRCLVEKRRNLGQYLHLGTEAVECQYPKLLTTPLPSGKSRGVQVVNQPIRVPDMLPERRFRAGSAPSEPPNRKPKIEGYSAIAHLGAGGNGDVWRCEDVSMKDCALKLLTKTPSTKRLTRFKNEVMLMRDLTMKQTAGVVPLLDSSTDAAPFFYAMPLGQPATQAFETSLLPAMQAIAELASTLAALHAQGIFHRDIKPENLLKIDGRWCFADFGLAEFPEATEVTTEGEKIGPYFNMPPEMRRTAITAEGGPADVYEFAKTVWMLLTGDMTGFDGRFESDNPSLSLTRLFPSRYLAQIEFLLHAATAYDPTQRPTMNEVSRVFNEWLEVHDEFDRSNRLEWEYTVKRLFPTRQPHRVEWTTPESIRDVLDILTHTSSLNHAFFPDGGGQDLMSVTLTEPDLLSLDFGIPHLCRPVRLELVIWPLAYEWSYFFLELDTLDGTGLDGTDARGLIEEYIVRPDGELRPPTYMDAGGEYVDDDFVPKPEGCERKARILGGNLVFLSKSSPYNMASETYDARHNKMGRLGYYEHVKQAVQATAIEDATL